MLTHAPSRAARTLLASLVALVLTAAVLVGSAPAARADAIVTVSGTVTAELAGGGYGPLEGVEVQLYPLHGDGQIFTTATTNSVGVYAATGVPTGTYHVYFNAAAISPTQPHASAWLGGTPLEASGDILTVAETDVAGVDVALELGGTISGTVTVDNATGPTSAAAAFLFDPDTYQFQRYSMRAVTDANGDYTIYGLPAGRYMLRFGDAFDAALSSTLYWDDSDYLWNSDPIDLADGADLTDRDGNIVSGGVWIGRVAGPGRFETSVAISQLFDPGDTTVAFIVNGMNFPDALSAGPAAARYPAPVLLVSPDSIPAAVAGELQRLGIETIFIVGGPPSVSLAVESQLHAYANDVYRVQGADRFDTSRLVAEIFFDNAINQTAYLATGRNFPDALTAGPAAANGFGPVILVDGAASTMDNSTRTLINDLGFERLVIAGGEPSVSAGVEESAQALPLVNEVYRHAGTNRFDTGVKVNRASFPAADAVFLATGTNFPDALAGAALAGSPLWRSPIYLVPTNCVPVDVLDEIKRLHPKDIILLGGEPSLSANVENLVPCV